MKQLLILVSFLCISLASRSQELEGLLENNDTNFVNRSRFLVKQFLELGISANAYKGDLSSYQKWTSMFHTSIKFNQARKINGRIGISIGFITGDNRFYTFQDANGIANPNTFFRSNFLSFDYEFQYNLFKTRTWIIYLSQGISLVRFEPKDEAGESLVNLQETRSFEETYNNFTISLPTGIGAMYMLKNGYAFGVQVQLLNTGTDYLDNISTWGRKAGNDNILRGRFSFFAPLKILPNRFIPPTRWKKREYTHQ